MEPIFISHSSRDADLVKRLVDDLEEADLPCWVAPRDVPLGADFTDAVVAAIGSAPALVLVHTAAALASRPCKREVGVAVDAGTPVVAMYIDDARAAEGWLYLLQQSQSLDARGARDRWLPRLVAELQRIVRAGGEVRPTEAKAPRPVQRTGPPAPLSLSMEECDALLAAAGATPSDVHRASPGDRVRFAAGWAAPKDAEGGSGSSWERLGTILGRSFPDRSKTDVDRAFDALAARGSLGRSSPPAP